MQNKMVHIRYFNISFLFLTIIFQSCLNVPKDVKKVLDLAKGNEKELIKLIDHYQAPGDSLKLKAAYFLIQNMHLNVFEEYAYYDNNGNHPLPDFGGLTTKELQQMLSEVSGGFSKVSEGKDIETITADYLIENIDLSFKVWEKYPWANRVNFTEFCRTILPYRIGREPLSDWRKFYYNKYQNELDSLAKAGADVKEVAFWLNEKSQKRYIQSTSIFPGNFNYKDFERIQGGNCYHLAQSAIKTMRACGIPLNFDVLTYHGRINGNHVYNSLGSKKNGDFVFFSPYDREPERNEWRSPRIMRKVFEIQKKEIYDYSGKYDFPNELFLHPLYKDVTSEYFPVGSIEINPVEPDSKKGLAYLCTYNEGRFHATAWSDLNNGKFTFSDITKELLYFPMSYNNSVYTPVSVPFIFRDSGEIEKLIVDRKNTVNIQGVQLFYVKKDITKPNKNYEVYYWDNKWVPFGFAKALENATLTIMGLPENTLYLIKGDEGEEKIQRPFSFIDGKIEYW